MRPVTLAALCTLALAPLTVQAQEVQVIKARGANAAGACVGALDMVARYMDRDPNTEGQNLARVQQARDTIGSMPQFPRADIVAAANAFVQLMSGRIVNAATVEEGQAVQRELIELSRQCIAKLNEAPPPPPAITTVPQGTILETQPLATQPLQTQPYEIQPYDTQPLILDPLVTQ